MTTTDTTSVQVSETPSTTITVNGKAIDLAEASPLNIGDWRRLKNKYGVTMKGLQGFNEDIDFDHLFGLLEVMVHKIDPSVPDEKIEEIPPTAKVLTAVGWVIRSGMEEEAHDPNS